MNINVPAPVVLVVEDEWLLRLELATALEDAGWTVLEADNGETALAILETCPALSVLITDIRLGGATNGWDVADAARTIAPLLPVIYVSANRPDPDRQVANSTFFSKPVQIPKLLPLCAVLMAR